MCNRSINVIDIEIMNGHAWDLKEFSIIGSMGDGMSVRIREKLNSLPKKEKPIHFIILDDVENGEWRKEKRERNDFI